MSALALLFLAMPGSASAATTTTTLDPLNDSGVTADAEVRLDGTSVTVSITATGAAADLPHAQHFHFEIGRPSTCPTPALDEDGDGLLSTVEGIPAYGSVQVSLTTEGDTSPASGLAVDRFPVANADGSYTYERTFEVSEEVAASLVDQQMAIVIHGIDLNGDGSYNGEAPSSLDPSLPLEATIPAACGIATIAAVDGQVFEVDTRRDTNDRAPGDGMCEDRNGRCSLRAAVEEANAGPGHDTIRLDDRVYFLRNEGPGEDAARTGDLDVTDNLTIEGNGAVIDGRSGDRLLDITAGTEVHLSHARLQRGHAPDNENGGAIRNAGTLHLDHVVIAKSQATSGDTSSGGAIVNNGDLFASQTILWANDATRAGGAIEATDGSMTRLSDVEMAKNTAGAMPGNGGALHVTGAGTVHVVDSLIRSNTAASEGGGLWNSSTGTMTLENTAVVRNDARGDAADNGGGGVFNDGGTLQITGGFIGMNTASGASGSGGGIANQLGDLEVDGSAIGRNQANRAGGGVETVDGTATFTRSRVSNNTVATNPGNGGGIHAGGSADVHLERSIVRRNEAGAEGGGLWASSGTTMTVSDSVVIANRAKGNDADQGGGGIYNDGGTVEVDAGFVVRNRATGVSGSGGGIFNNDGMVTVDGTAVLRNRANRAGGGIEANVGTTHVRNAWLNSNITGDNPGNGGGFHITGAGSATVENSDVRRNVAASEGGGLWNSSTGTLDIVNATVRGNRAPEGPNVFNDGGTVTTTP